jgi:flagellar assembly factor FliW
LILSRRAGESLSIGDDVVDQSLEFPLIHPSSLPLNYRFDTDAEVLATLEADSSDQLVPMLIITLRDRLEEITVNLQGPLVLNPRSCKGLQLVVEDYPFRYPLVGTAPFRNLLDKAVSGASQTSR